jgi:uncharacterized protein (DUF2141 family)
MQTAIRTAILVLFAAGASLAQAADLTIRVDNVQNNDGQVMVALYDGAGNFLKRPSRQAAVEAIAGSTTVVFKDLASGDYAFAVFHDANGNGRMDKNAMGIPTESYAFSNDAQGVMGPPAFDAARLAVPASGAAVTVNLR